MTSEASTRRDSRAKAIALYLTEVKRVTKDLSTPKGCRSTLDGNQIAGLERAFGKEGIRLTKGRDRRPVGAGDRVERLARLHTVWAGFLCLGIARRHALDRGPAVFGGLR